jgi:hypothetical protein
VPQAAQQLKRAKTSLRIFAGILDFLAISFSPIYNKNIHTAADKYKRKKDFF